MRMSKMTIAFILVILMEATKVQPYLYSTDRLQ